MKQIFNNTEIGKIDFETHKKFLFENGFVNLGQLLNGESIEILTERMEKLFDGYYENGVKKILFN